MNKNNRRASNFILVLAVIITLSPNAITAENIADLPMTITSAYALPLTNNAQTIPLALTAATQAAGLTVTPGAVLSLEQMDDVLLKTNPKMFLQNPWPLGNEEDSEIIEFVNCSREKILNGLPERIIVKYSSYGSCSNCCYHGIIVVDDNLNTLSVFREATRDLQCDFEFVDLKCDGVKQFQLLSHHTWAGGAGSEDYTLYEFDKNLRVTKLMATEVSDLPPAETPGEKYPVHGKLTLGECRAGKYRDIIIQKNCEHYDEYYSEDKGETVKDYLEKSWIVRETWRHTWNGYVLYKRTGRDPGHLTVFDRIYDFFHKNKVKKSKLKPWMEMGG